MHTRELIAKQVTEKGGELSKNALIAEEADSYDCDVILEVRKTDSDLPGTLVGLLLYCISGAGFTNSCRNPDAAFNSASLKRSLSLETGSL